MKGRFIKVNTEATPALSSIITCTDPRQQRLRPRNVSPVAGWEVAVEEQSADAKKEKRKNEHAGS